MLNRFTEEAGDPVLLFPYSSLKYRLLISLPLCVFYTIIYHYKEWVFYIEWLLVLPLLYYIIIDVIALIISWGVNFFFLDSNDGKTSIFTWIVASTYKMSRAAIAVICVTVMVNLDFGVTYADMIYHSSIPVMNVTTLLLALLIIDIGLTSYFMNKNTGGDINEVRTKNFENTLEELKKINVIGKKKIETFQDLYCEIIKKYKSNHLCYDCECIEDEEDYSSLVSSYISITEPKLTLENLESKVNWDKNRAFIKFKINGKKFQWKFKQSDDWINDKFHFKIAKFINENLSGNGVIVTFPSEDQCLEVLCLPPDVAEILTRNHFAM